MKFTSRYKFDSAKDLVGKGGFAKVYKAYDVVRKRMVALKFYHGIESEKYDILSEINRVEDLVHPNLIRYYDANIIHSVNAIGEKEEIQVGIMEYANAGDLGDFFKKRRTQKTIHHIVVGILKGLKYLHEHGFVHRDLKPKNILLSKKEQTLVAKLADFGISKKVGSDDGNVSSQLLGSVEYMAPEQFAPAVYGLDGKIGTNVDLWSIGVIMYETFAETLPFGSRTKGIRYEQILNNILFHDLNVNYDLVPEPYRTAIRKCLVKKASERAADAQELIDILEGKQAINTNISTQVLNKPVENIKEPVNKTAVITPPTKEPVQEPENIKTQVLTNHQSTNKEADNSEKATIINPVPPVTEDEKPSEPILAPPKEKRVPITASDKAVESEMKVGKNLFKLGNYPDSFQILDQFEYHPLFDTEAKFYLGYMYYNGKCGGAHDPQKGRKMMAEAKRENRVLVQELMIKYVLGR